LLFFLYCFFFLPLHFWEQWRPRSLVLWVGNVDGAGSRYRVVILETAPHAGWSGVLIPVGAGDFSYLKNHQDLWVPLTKLFSGYQASGSWGMKLTAYVHPVPRLGMSGVVPWLSLYAFMAWIV
jgi:hypothetical protein